MKSEYIISDFAKAVQEKDRLAAKSHPDRWEAVPYETADVSGTLLIASEMTNRTPVTVCPALDGWYRIYVCMLNAGGEYICLHLYPRGEAPRGGGGDHRASHGEGGGVLLEMCRYDGQVARDLQTCDGNSVHGEHSLAPIRSDDGRGGAGVPKAQRRSFP